MSLIRSTTNIVDIERGSTSINYVYRGSSLVWSRTQAEYIVNNFSTFVDAFFLKSTNIQYQTIINIKM